MSRYFSDHLGTPVLQTDAAANVVWRVKREPYGASYVVRAGADRHQPLAFPGQEEGVEGEIAYNVFRWYRGGWGRYTQADPVNLGIIAGRLVPREHAFRKRDLRAQSSIRTRSPQWEHAFSYVAARPLSYSDAKGLFGPGGLAGFGGAICMLDSPVPGPMDAIGGTVILLAGLWGAANWIDDLFDQPKKCDDCDKKASARRLSRRALRSAVTKRFLRGRLQIKACHSSSASTNVSRRMVVSDIDGIYGPYISFCCSKKHFGIRFAAE